MALGEGVVALASAWGHQKPGVPGLEKPQVLPATPQPTQGEDPQGGGTASTKGKLWRRQEGGSGVLFNPFLPKLPRHDETSEAAMQGAHPRTTLQGERGSPAAR